MEDGFLPFKQITENDKEIDKKQLKDFEDPFEFEQRFEQLYIHLSSCKFVLFGFSQVGCLLNPLLYLIRI